MTHAVASANDGAPGPPQLADVPFSTGKRALRYGRRAYAYREVVDVNVAAGRDHPAPVSSHERLRRLGRTDGTPGPGAFRHHRLLLRTQPPLGQAELLAGIHHIPAVDRYLASGPCTTMAVRRR